MEIQASKDVKLSGSGQSSLTRIFECNWQKCLHISFVAQQVGHVLVPNHGWFDVEPPLSLNSLKWFSHINDRCWAQIINCNHRNKYTKFTSKNQILLTKKIKLTFYSLLFITCCWKIAFVPFLYNSHLLPGGVNPPLSQSPAFQGSLVLWQATV